MTGSAGSALTAQDSAGAAEWVWLPRQLIVVVMVVLVVLPWFSGPGIPSGRENNAKAAAFVKEKYPGRSLARGGWRTQLGQKEPGCRTSSSAWRPRRRA